MNAIGWSSATTSSQSEVLWRAAGFAGTTGLVLVAILLSSAAWCDTACAQSGMFQRTAGGGLAMEVDTVWVSGPGYRPVRIRVTPTAPAIADRTLTVEFSVRRYWNYSRDEFQIVQDIEIPAGSGPVQATISVPQTIGWTWYQVTVLEDGDVIKRLGGEQPVDQQVQSAWEEQLPRVLFVGDKFPDTSSMARELHVWDYYQQAPGRFQVQVVPAKGGAIPPPMVMGGAAPNDLDMPLPTSVALPADNLPDKWIDYTNVDLIFVTADDLAYLSRQRKEVLQAIFDWTSAGGNLCVYNVGWDWGRLPELESLMGVEPGSEDQISSPATRGWTIPDRSLTGKPIKGVGVASTSYYGGGMQYSQPDVSEYFPEEDVLPEDWELPIFHFVTRELALGVVVALADENPFPAGQLVAGLEPEQAGLPAGDDEELRSARGELEWSWVFNTLSSRRFLWYQRHGVSGVQDNELFWQFLIPGVGLAPVNGFRVLITLFVLAIGPLNYYLLKRWRSLHLLVVTVPVCATAVTLALFAYALVADGLGTRVRVRSLTQIDQARGQTVCWSRLSFYAGLSPYSGMRFPNDVAVIPFEYLPSGDQSRTRELIWEDDQRLTKGWLPSRTPTQFLTIRSRQTDAKLTITEPVEYPIAISVTNQLGTAVEQLLLRNKDGQYFWATNLAQNANGQAEPIDLGKARTLLRRSYSENAPAYPPGMDRSGPSNFSNSRQNRSRWRWMGAQPNLPQPNPQTSLMERVLAIGGTKTLEPGTYLAVVQRSPEVEVGVEFAAEEAGFHVISGTW